MRYRKYTAVETKTTKLSLLLEERERKERKKKRKEKYHKRERIGAKLDEIGLAGGWRWGRRRGLLLSPGGSLQRGIIRVDGRVYVLGQRSSVILAAAAADRRVRGDEIVTRHGNRISVGVIDGQPGLRGRRWQLLLLRHGHRAAGIGGRRVLQH